MALAAAWQMCSGVWKSGSPRLKSKTFTPSAFICLALAPAARVAEGWTAAAIREIGIISAFLQGIPLSRRSRTGAWPAPVRDRRLTRRGFRFGGIVPHEALRRERRSGRTRNVMRIAHFVQRYPPALGGSEAYFARLSRHLAASGDAVTVFTTNALDLEAFWRRRARCLPAGITQE